MVESERRIASSNRCSRANPCRVCGKDHYCLNLVKMTLCTDVASDYWNEGLEGWFHPLPGESWDDERAKEAPERQEQPTRPARATIASPLKRHQVYSQMQGILRLADEHWRHLGSARRGMSPDEIESRGYRTAYFYENAPPDPEDRAFRLATLLRDFGDLHTVPGFGERGRYFKAGSEVAAAVCLAPRIMIPIRSVEGLIQGWQMLDPSPECHRKKRYIWFSGVGAEGASIGKPLHVSLPYGKQPGKHVIITEGPLKADIISTRTGKITIAFQGVKSIDWDALDKTLDALGVPAARVEVEA